MTKEVWVRVKGIQTIDGEQGEPIEIIVPGDYYRKKEKHYLFYDEVSDEEGSITKNRVVISPTYVDIIKKGASDTHMILEQGIKHRSNYQTPFGVFLMEFFTEKVEVEETEDTLRIYTNYELSVNGESQAQCSLEMTVCSKSKFGLL